MNNNDTPKDDKKNLIDGLSSFTPYDELEAPYRTIDLNNGIVSHWVMDGTEDGITYCKRCSQTIFYDASIASICDDCKREMRTKAILTGIFLAVIFTAVLILWLSTVLM